MRLIGNDRKDSQGGIANRVCSRLASANDETWKKKTKTQERKKRRKVGKNRGKKEERNCWYEQKFILQQQIYNDYYNYYL